ncbi:MAG: hypothetical protein ACYSX0_09230 [Planctomycetota bacterium]|jgi:hypothetical protein
MNQLERWHENDVIQIEIAETAQSEAAHGSPARASKAYQYIFTMSMGGTPQEAQLLKRIEETLFPNGATTPAERNDADIVFNAAKYQCILVTNDGGSRRQPGGILGNRGALRELGIQVLTDEEAVALVRQLISSRDQRERLRSERTGEPLPEWVGTD